MEAIELEPSGNRTNYLIKFIKNQILQINSLPNVGSFLENILFSTKIHPERGKSVQSSKLICESQCPPCINFQKMMKSFIM